MAGVTVRSPSSSPSQATALPSPPSLPPSFCTNLAILTRDRHSDAVKFKMLGGEGIGETFAFAPSAWDLRFKEGLILPPLATLFPFHFGFHLNFFCWGGMALSCTPLPAASPFVSALMIPTAIGEGVAVAPTCTLVGVGPGPEPPSWAPSSILLLPSPTLCPRRKQ